MKTFACVTNPISITQLKEFQPALRLIPDFILKSSLKKIPPFKASEIKTQNKETLGYLIICPLLPEQLQDEDLALEKIIACAKMAEKLGAKILGLCGWMSMIGEKAESVVKDLKIPLTTGSTYTAWSVFEAIYRMAKVKNVDLAKSSVAIINAANAIGSLCARKLSERVAKIILCGSQTDKLESLKEAVLHLNAIEIIIENDAKNAAKDADIIININSATGLALSAQTLKTNSILCDVSFAQNPAQKIERNDITVINAGLIKLPSAEVTTACMAETMLLALEGKCVSYSFGENINLDKMEEIADLGTKHGFEVWVPEAPVL